MFLVVGLGNPGHEHESQRHNLGFLVLDSLARAAPLSEYRTKFQGLCVRGKVGEQEIALLKPQTFMNRSGESVRAAALFYKVLPAELLVVHDELDLPWGEVRIKLGGGHAGHNGIRSIVEHLGTADFVRIRIGIGRPTPTSASSDVAFGRGPISAPSPREWVLSKFGATELLDLPRVLERAESAIRRILQDGLAAAQTAMNAKTPG